LSLRGFLYNWAYKANSQNIYLILKENGLRGTFPQEGQIKSLMRSYNTFFIIVFV